MTAAVRSVGRDASARPEEVCIPGTDAGFWVRLLTTIYTLAVGGAVRVASWWFRRSGRWTKDGIRQRRGELLPAVPSSPPIWIHGASLGEVRVGGFFAEALLRRHHIVIASAMTEPGFRLCHDVYPEATATFRVPFDLPRPIERVLSHFRPQALILVETEWWPNLLRGAVARGLPIFVINGRLSQDAYRRYRLSAAYWRTLLQGVHFFYMRSEADAQRVISLGIDPKRVTAAGLMKAPPVAATPASPPEPDNWRVWVAGCTRPGEETIILDAFHSLRTEFGDLCLWLAPRHLERVPQVVALARRAGYDPVRWSAGGGSIRDRVGIPLVVVDEAGILPELYGWAEVAFVGGSLRPFGGHNPLEPALAGARVLFGPHMEEQGDATAMLLDAQLARQVPDGQSLTAAVAAVLRSRQQRDMRQARADILRGRLLRVRDEVADDLIARTEAAQKTGRGQRTLRNHTQGGIG